MDRPLMLTVVAVLLGLDLTASWAHPPVRRPHRDIGATPTRVRSRSSTAASSATSITLAPVGIVGMVIGSATIGAVSARVPVVGATAALTVMGVLRHRHRRVERRRTEARQAALPALLDALVALIRSGLSPATAWRELPSCCPPELDDVVRRVITDIDHGSLFADALGRAVDDLGDSARGLFDALVTAERYGLPLVPALDRLSADAAAERRRLVETRSRQLPVRMSIPLVVCTLPAFVVLGIIPLMIAALSSLTRP